jgi:hypothetical protein
MLNKALRVAHIGILIAAFCTASWLTACWLSGTIGATRKIQIESLVITVPESLPDFSQWGGNILGVKNYSNGNAVAAIEAYSPDHGIYVMALFARVSKEISIIAIQMDAFLPDWDKDGVVDTSKIKTTFYEDVTFMQIGKISYVLIQVESPTDFQIIESHIAKIAIYKGLGL